MDSQIADSAGRLFALHVTPDVLQSAEQGSFPQILWDALAEAGFIAAMLPEDAGGYGATVAEAMGLVRIAAGHAAPVPLGETMLAGWLLGQAGLSVPVGPLTLGPVRANETLTLRREARGWRLQGQLTRIPWARNVAAIAAVADGPDGPAIVSVSAGTFATTHSRNLAGEPRDIVALDTIVAADAVAPAPRDFGPLQLRAAGASLRANQIAGAVSRVLALTISYAQTRVQFGRPIGKFQAIQHNLAVLAGQFASSVAAADIAADAIADGLDPMRVGAAKARAGEAATAAAALAHQIHGAIGFTQEYELHRLTRRLWSWRDEFGNEAEWNGVVGRAALVAGAAGLWPAIASA